MSESATLIQRIVAGVIDQVIILVGIGILAVLGLFSLSLTGYLSAMAMSYLMWIVYYTFFEGTSGQTIGKRFVGIRVVMRDGRELGFAIAFIRTLFRIIDSLPTLYILGIIFILVTSDKQRLGDMVAGTVVIED